ncbi:PAS domain S-box protein [Flavobacterium limnophilum]|uniref:PAS domain S-box protein n=1 Tax=Flavobacterium limnophilum TaxID=3003262 RepID=UPI0024823E6D|nr:PAS domain S-box protein [Flavobacterium limnophilum]
MKDKAPQSSTAILRRKAEEILKNKSLMVDTLSIESETLKLIHELDVHQIELEMQNEELKIAKEQLEIAAEKYINLYDFAPSGYFTLSRDGDILELNFRGANMLGKERSFLINNRFAFFVSENNRFIFNSFLDKIFKEQTKQTCEITISINAEAPTHLLLNGMVLSDEEQCVITAVDISKRKKAEEDLKINKEKYQTIFDSNRDSITIFRLTPDGRNDKFIEVNEASTEIFGYSKQELLSMTTRDLEHVTAKKMKTRMETLLSNGKIDFETSIRTKKGKTRSVEVKSLLINYLNEPAVMNITRDITERKQIESNSKKAHENLATILDAIPDLMFEVGIDGRIYHYHSNRIDLLSAPPELFIGKFFQDFLPAEVTKICMGAILEADEKGWSSGQQYSLDLAKGKHWFELSVSPINESDSKDRHFILLARDVTIRKQAEETLRQNEEKLQGVFNLANSGILMVDKNGHFSLYNDWCCDMFGYTREEFGKLTNLEITHPDDIKKTQRSLNDIIEGRIKKYQIEKRYLKKDKTFFWGEISVSAITDKNNNVTNAIGIISDITERKKIEEKLIANDAFLIQTQIIANLGSYSLDFSTGKWTSSPVLDSIFGIDSNFEKTTENWITIVHPEWKETIKDYFNNEIIDKKSDFNKDYKIIRINDKEERWVHGVGKIMYNEQNEPLHLIGSIQDITEKRIIEDSLRESEEKYRSLVENSPDAVVIYIEGKIVFVNEEGIRMIAAKSKNEIIGKPVLEFIHPDSIESVIQRMIDVVKDSNASDIVEEKFIDLQGNPIDVEIKAIPTSYEHKEAVQVIIHDITERKRTQEKIKQLSQAVEQSPVTIVITNTEGNIEYVNPKFSETTGYTFDEVTGKNPRVLKSGHTSPNEYKELWQTLSTGREWHGEFHNMKKNGELYWESASISPIINNQGKITHYIAIKEDITDRKKAEEELIKAKEKAEESDRLKLAFLANMSHEIRTPMNGILGFTELLKSPNLAGEEQQEYIKIIEKSGIRMLNIINDIISISKVESGQVDITFSETNINEQIEYLHTFFKPEAKQKGIQLSINTPLSENETIINTDREKIYAILTNLVKNALKFTYSGSIEFGYAKKGNHLEFFVKDTGLGIPSSQQKIIFERFRQANDTISRSHEGSGLGLAISKAYVEMLGGKIWVESKEGKGSSFYFTIPFDKKLESNDKIISKKDVAKEKTENEIKDLKVLIVEDDAISKLLITIAIKPFSKEILKVSTGFEAIEACRNNPDIDLVMMDINMPEMGGYEATERIREFNKDLVIIAQTANGMQSDRDEAIAAGCTDYISKPVNIAALGELIHQYFKR